MQTNSHSNNRVVYGSLAVAKTGAGKVGIGVFDVLAFLVPATQFIQLHVVGQLLMPDILLAGILPILFFARGKKLLVGLPKMFIILTLLWLVSQMMTDAIRDSEFSDYSRGWAKIGFTLTNFSALYLLLYGSQRRIFLYIAGLAAGGLIAYFVNPNIRAEYYPWKFGYGGPLTLLLILMAATMAGRKGRHPTAVLAILFGVAGLNLVMGTRGGGLIVFLTACYLYVQAKWGSQGAGRRIRPHQYVLIAIVSIFAGLAMSQIYGYTASSGILGEDAQKKYKVQSQGRYGLFIGGRSEILVSSVAIADSPILGHGSWAKDCRYALLFNELREDAGYVVGGGNDFSTEVCLIPSHSHLFGAWIEAGLLGAVFWVWVLSLPIRVLLKPRGTTDSFTLLVIFSALTLAWTILFSPYGADGRFVTTFYVVVMMSCLSAHGRTTASRSVRGIP